MPAVELYGGPQKRTLIQRAFGMCGQSVTEYELSPEEYDLALQCANDIASTLGATFPWNAPDYGVGSPNDESGLPQSDVIGFVTMLALEVAQNIGKQLSPNGQQSRAMSSLRAKYAPVPFMELGRHTPRGAGNRNWGSRPYFVTETASDEPVQ